MRNYTIEATVRKEEEDGSVKTYGTSRDVQGPDSLEEFVAQLGQSGTLEVLTRNFKEEQAAILRKAIAEKIGKEKPGSAGRLANAIAVDLD